MAAFLGLVPRRDQSGESDKQLRITKAGDSYLRKLLVGAAQYTQRMQGGSLPAEVIFIDMNKQPEAVAKHALNIVQAGGRDSVA